MSSAENESLEVTFTAEIHTLQVKVHFFLKITFRQDLALLHC